MNLGATRYRFLETVREFAAVALREHGEEEACRQRHLALFRCWYPPCQEGINLQVIRHTSCDHYNFQLAIATALAANPPRTPDAVALICLHARVLHHFWEKAMPLLDELLPDLAPDLRVPFPRVMADYALAAECGYYPLLDGPLKALGYYILVARRHFFPNTPDNIAAYATIMLALYRQAEFPAGIAYALNEMADIVHREGNSAQAIAYREEASAIARTLPYKGFLLHLLWKQGQQALIEAQTGRARALLEEWYAAATNFARCTAIFPLIQTEYLDGRYDQARAYYGKAMEVFNNHPCEHRLLGDIAREEGRLTEAVQQYALSIAQWEPAGRQQCAEVYFVTLESYAYLCRHRGKLLGRTPARLRFTFARGDGQPAPAV